MMTMIMMMDNMREYGDNGSSLEGYGCRHLFDMNPSSLRQLPRGASAQLAENRNLASCCRRSRRKLNSKWTDSGLGSKTMIRLLKASTDRKRSHLRFKHIFIVMPLSSIVINILVNYFSFSIVRPIKTDIQVHHGRVVFGVIQSYS